MRTVYFFVSLIQEWVLGTLLDIPWIFIAYQHPSSQLGLSITVPRSLVSLPQVFLVIAFVSSASTLSFSSRRSKNTSIGGVANHRRCFNFIYGLLRGPLCVAEDDPKLLIGRPVSACQVLG